MIKLRRIVEYIQKEAVDTPPAIVQQNTNTQPSNVVNQQAINNAYILAATIWGEARSEGERGMQAVLNVILNRARGDVTNASKIALSPKQFSFWNNKTNAITYAHQLAGNHRGQDKSYDQALAIVDKAMKRELPDVTGGATFYFNPKLANPSWAKTMKKTATIGNHDFYKPVAKKK